MVLLAPALASVISWLLREVIIKFVIFTAILAVVAFFVPYVVSYLGNFINPQTFTNAFNLIPSGVWFVAQFFSLEYGIKLIISASIARFLIRRLPFIG
jgi:ABC-type thiamin/hydroxymethylpyrimidine transport system permease subunit